MHSLMKYRLKTSISSTFQYIYANFRENTKPVLHTGNWVLRPDVLFSLKMVHM